VNFGSNAGMVRVKAVNACAAGSLSSITVAFTCRGEALATEPVTRSTNVLVFPNPTIDMASMQLPDAVQHATVTVVDMFGKVVMSKVSMAGSNVQLGIAQLAKGNYIIRVQDATHYYVGKFMKQ
jgi:hypothetical protein